MRRRPIDEVPWGRLRCGYLAIVLVAAATLGVLDQWTWAGIVLVASWVTLPIVAAVGIVFLVERPFGED